MTGLARGVCLAIGLWALAAPGAAGAQEDLDKGKSGAQLYAANCAICHKSPQRLDIGKAGGLFGLDSFLREHYTASRGSAAAISAYLKGVQQAMPAAPPRGRAHKQTAKRGHDGKGEEHGKPAASKPAEDKAAEAKPAEKTPKTTASAKPKKPDKPE